MANGSQEPSGSYLELLDQQYALVEAYANAQTLLFNASANPNSAVLKQEDDNTFDEFSSLQQPIVAALERLEEAKWKLRSNFRDLHSHTTTKQQLRSQHLGLSERVIATIAKNPSWHLNGLPDDAGRNNFAQSALEANTVAIAALNASIARIKDIEGNP